MASCHKGEGDVTTEPDDASSTNEEYFHNPEDFIDIHANEKPVKYTDNESVHKTDCQPNSECSPLTNCSWSLDKDSCCPNSKFVEDLKTPVQVSEDSDVCTNFEKKTHIGDDSEEEYHSAEESCSSDDFVPEDDDCDNNDFLKQTNADSDNTGEINATECDEENSCSESDKDEKETEIVDDLEIRKKTEELLSAEEILERKNKSQQLKDEGNTKFRNGLYDEAIKDYTEALDICPLTFHKEISIMFANRAACYMKKELYTEAIKDSTKAIDLHPHYLKAILRRAELYEKTDKLDEALQDYKKVVELDPSQHMARAACMKLAEQIKDRNEKLKDEMIGKLKDLGNLVLRPFGLSVNNFNIQQDPSSGSYSVQFQQNQPNNGR
uniref:Tetratricopeptide repeat protein 1 n=1 Tax=Biomphalaria glabrata TaxID=6526 RepID=A0A2C9JP70_BIOGL